MAKREEFHEYITKMAKMQIPASPLSKQFTSEKETKETMNVVMPILMQLHERYLRYYGMY
jgi:hypothetical protein